MTKQDNIANLYDKIAHKGKFWRLVAQETDRSLNTIKNHWLPYGTPEEFEDTVIRLAQKTIKHQNITVD